MLPLDRFHVSSTLHRTVRQNKFEIRINFDFEATIRECMSNRADGSWINAELIAGYRRLHEMGCAHSVEAWQGNKLVGGLYGVSLGGAFFGESMFHRVTDASKVALVHLVHRLRDRGFTLLDTQASTTHLRRFGCVDIPARDYLRLLKAATKKQCTFA